MSRNSLYALLALLAVVVIGLAVYVYQEQQKPSLDVRIDETGVSIDGNG